MLVNEQSIYDATLARWGHDRQMLKTIDACGQLAGGYPVSLCMSRTSDRSARPQSRLTS